LFALFLQIIPTLNGRPVCSTYIGQELPVRLVLPRDYRGQSGNFRSKVVHIDIILEGPFKGHLIVGLYFLTGITSA
jgi:hypothetical protein